MGQEVHDGGRPVPGSAGAEELGRRCKEVVRLAEQDGQDMATACRAAGVTQGEFIAWSVAGLTTSQAPLVHSISELVQSYLQWARRGVDTPD